MSVGTAKHAQRFAQNKLTGCTCGWRPKDEHEAGDVEDQLALHVATITVDRVRSAYVDKARAMSAAERDRQRVDAADETVCTCGWITARDVCPICGCVRVPDAISPE